MIRLSKVTRVARLVDFQQERKQPGDQGSRFAGSARRLSRKAFLGNCRRIHKSSDEYESISFPASPVFVPVLNSLMMNDESGPLAADREFFAALLRGSVEDLNRVVADDFILIEVMGG